MATNLQKFGLTCLLCAPSSLQKVWLESDDPVCWGKALDEYALNDRAAALEFLKQLAHRKPFFNGVALLLQDTDEYTEDPPHPSLEDAKLLMQRLQ